MPRSGSKHSTPSKFEKLISSLCGFLILLFFTNLVLLLFVVYRQLLLRDFPNSVFLSLLILFIAAVLRVAEADERGKSARRETCYDGSAHQDLTGPYDLMGSGREYSNGLANIIFLIVVAGCLFTMGL